jgi:hypothetical protein
MNEELPGFAGSMQEMPARGTLAMLLNCMKYIK